MEPVRWGILPVSRHFELRVATPLASLPGAAIQAVASRNPAKAAEAAVRYGAVNACGYEELLENPAVEAVYISLPNDMHAQWSIRAMRAGKHVLCEKPFAMNAGEAVEVAAIARETGRFLMEAFMYRFHPQWRLVKQLVQRGEIGTLLAVHTFFCFMNTDPSNIRNRPGNGGGSIYDIGCYAVNSARYIFGREPQRVVSLLSRDAVFGTDTLSSGLLDFGGPRATFTVATQSFARQQVEIVGSAGRILVELPFNAWPDVAMTVSVTTSIGTRTWHSAPADQYGLMFAEVSRAIREGATAPTGIQDAIANQAVLDALFASERSGGWESVARPEEG